MHYNHIEAYNNGFNYPLTQPTFYSLLKQNGYSVGGVGKFDLHKPVLFWGKSGWINQLEILGFTDAVDSEGKYDAVFSSFKEPRGPYGNYLHEHGLLGIHRADYIKRYYNVYETSETPLPHDAYADNWVTKNAVDLLLSYTKKQNPWFLMVNFSGPHDPWDITREMKRLHNDTIFPEPVQYAGNSNSIHEVRRNYGAMLENIDTQIGHLVAALKATGQLENTIIIYASDHGEMLGDHNMFFKCKPQFGSISIPLVISGEGTFKGNISNELVQLHDLAATILDFADIPIPEEMDSVSLKDLATKEHAAGVREYQAIMLCNGIQNSHQEEGYEEYAQFVKTKSDSEFIDEFNRDHGYPSIKRPREKRPQARNWWATITKEFKLVEYEDGKIELYNLANDPDETSNIASNHLDTVKELMDLYDFSILQHRIAGKEMREKALEAVNQT